MHTSQHSKNILVFYHSHCADGFGAAWAAWKALGESAEFISYTHGHDLTLTVVGKQVYSLDITFPALILERVMREATSYTVIDHHVTGKDRASQATHCLFDLTHSGAVLAWKFFHPALPVPLLLQYIEENDLWRYTLPHAKELAASLALSNYSFTDWDERRQAYEQPEKLQKYIDEGKIILAKSSKDASEVADNHYLIDFEGMRVPVANTQGLSSIVGHELATKFPPLAIIWSRRKNDITVSLRGNGSIDVSAIATRYGGGGHPNAAGFTIVLSELLSLADPTVRMRQQSFIEQILACSPRG